MAHEFIISERGFLVTWPIDFLSGVVRSLRSTRNLTDAAFPNQCARCFPFLGNGQLLYIQRVKKKLEEKVQLLVPSLLLRKGGFLEERGW